MNQIFKGMDEAIEVFSKSTEKLNKEIIVKLRQRKMVFNGNEIVFEDAPNIGVAGIANNMPDELAEMIVKRWNDAEPCDGCHEAPVDCPGATECVL